MSDGCCGTCCFWVLTSHAITDEGDEKKGNCHRYPPTALDLECDSEYWCGEYHPDVEETR